VDVRPAGPLPKVNETSEPWYESWGLRVAFAAGKFSLGDIPEGACNVRIKSHETSAERGVTIGQREVTVSAGQTKHLEFQIEDWENKRRQRQVVTPRRRVSRQESSVKTAVQVEAEETEKTDSLVWGKEVNGLRAAVEFVPEKGSYEQGEVVGIRFHLQNVSNQIINLSTPRWWIKSRCLAEDQLGIKMPARRIPEPWGMTTIDRHKLLPGQVIKLESGSLAIAKDETQGNRFYKYPVHNVVTLKPGQYSLYYRLSFPGITRLDGDGKVVVPQPDDWQGALETGKRKLVIISNAESDQKLVVQVEGEVATPEEFRKKAWKVFGLPPGVGDYLDSCVTVREEMNPEKLITVRCVDNEGKGISYCRVVFVDRDEQVRLIDNVATDEKGYAYCDDIDGPFSIMAQVFDYSPLTKAWRFQHKKIEKLYNANDKPVITVQWPPFPEGIGQIQGNIKDQYDHPLKEFDLVLAQREGENEGWGDCFTKQIEKHFIHPEGNFEIGNLAAGTYTYYVYPKEQSAYVWDFNMGEFTVAAEDTVQLNIEIEAKKTDVAVEAELVSFAQECAKRIMEAYHQEQPKQDHTNYITESLIYHIDSNDLTEEKKERQIKGIVESIKEQFDPNPGHNLAIAGFSDSIIIVDIYKREKKSAVEI
jgi:hypothetical protein